MPLENLKIKNVNNMENQIDNQNDLLDDINTSVKKSKLNPVGVYFVISLILSIWKITDIVIYLIHLI